MMPPPPPRHRRSSGVALIVVLAIIVLVVGIVVAFLTMAGTERTSASSYLSSAEVRRLADNAVAIVQAQINYATTQGPTVAWASQPGMIRTYSDNGTLLRAYKLYSATSLTETDPASLNSDTPAAAWRSSPATWTDLNAPVTTGGQTIYPIIDPAVLTLPVSDRPEGFEINNAPVAGGPNPAPMPVRWLYILQDGQVVAAGGSGNTVTVTGASSNNPITGRIAFWTDDETAKVNLNTAGDGTSWDVPRFSTTEDRQYATNQPVNGEFQRYPGHPATTSLRAVFPNLTSFDILSTITPRYQWGGSENGTVGTYNNPQALNGGTVADRPLFATVDEARFQPSRSARTVNTLLSDSILKTSRFFLTTSSRSPEVNLFNLPRVAIWPIAQNSSSRTAFDEVIAFASSIDGKPYYFQRTNALSSTADAAIGRNQQIYNYLRSLADETIPGFGVDLASKFGADTDQILTEIWDYIRCTNLYDTRLPAGSQFTGPLNGDGYGYAAPLINTTGGNNYRGFGRSITLSELAFIFICTADSVYDPALAASGASATDGLLESNDPARNRTLGGTRLDDKQRRVQMMILPEFFSPSQGYVNIRPKYMRITIRGLSGLSIAGQPLFAYNEATMQLDPSGAAFNNKDTAHTRGFGGPFDYRAPLFGRIDPGLLDSGSMPTFPFISRYVTVPADVPNVLSSATMPFVAAAPLTITLETSPDGSTWTGQVLHVNPGSSAVPVPNLALSNSGPTASPALTQEWWGFSYSSPWSGVTKGRLRDLNGSQVGNEISPYSGAVIRADQAYPAVASRRIHTDVVRTMVPANGDYRLVAAMDDVPQKVFVPLRPWSTFANFRDAFCHTLGLGLQAYDYTPTSYRNRRHFVVDNTTATPSLKVDGTPDFPATASSSALSELQLSGDFDNGNAWNQDGAFINKPDEGNIYFSGSQIPYYIREGQDKLDSTSFFSPNRMIPGPGMFGSLPTHVKRFQANPTDDSLSWRTLLFRKHPNHPNEAAVSPGGLPSTLAPDHLLMDLFWMPTVEPYAISDPLATAGKVNMNYQIQPFTYLKRATGLYAVLKNEKITAVTGDTTEFNRYKTTASASVATYRQPINIPDTLQQFDSRFSDSSGRLFLSPTELCDLWLVPSQTTLGGTATFWQSRRLTGDNMRERPYTTIIPRLTTKSNSYTVHMRVQSLKRPPGGDVATWDETRGVVTAEYRGSTTIERFIDPGSDVPDYATNPSATPQLDTFYRWRTIANRQFAP